MSEIVLETRQLTKTYKNRAAVNNVSLSLNKGDIYGFLGPNGAGKTTTIRMLLGLIRPTAGSVHVFGKPLATNKLDILRRVGSLVEYPSYYGHLTARENLETIRRILDVPVSRIDEVLAIVRLTGEERRPVKGFSLGMKQRLGIAAALLGNPELLILDEPTNGLDPAGIHEIRELIKSMPKEFGVTVLISSHLLSEIEHMANRVGIIREGQLIFQDSIEMLKRQASSQLRLSVSDPETARLTIARYDSRAVLEDGALYLDLLSDEQIGRLVAHLVQEGHSVYRVEEIRKSLEDLFLDLVGGDSL
ncbi:ABC transporter ATP-binding protein [Gorillibacterium timonense]|uniref:ABC transporter ATP-binding protein n=1 Tax=Gorillibacterium timonense TaxID=1689269 RepID=UPI00071DB493|nr:ABC transporter ATP-binding protein [Gorillibacterium timonense]